MEQCSTIHLASRTAEGGYSSVAWQTLDILASIDLPRRFAAIAFSINIRNRQRTWRNSSFNTIATLPSQNHEIRKIYIYHSSWQNSVYYLDHLDKYWAQVKLDHACVISADTLSFYTLSEKHQICTRLIRCAGFHFFWQHYYLRPFH